MKMYLFNCLLACLVTGWMDCRCIDRLTGRSLDGFFNGLFDILFIMLMLLLLLLLLSLFWLIIPIIDRSTNRLSDLVNQNHISGRKQYVHQKTDYTLCSTQSLVAQVSVAALAAHFVVVVVSAAGTHVLCAVLQDENDKMFKTQMSTWNQKRRETQTQKKKTRSISKNNHSSIL